MSAKSLASSYLEAISAVGPVFQHIRGGVYRIIKLENDQVEYEHLWPYAHKVQKRPVREFFERMDDKRLRYHPLSNEAQKLHPETQSAAR